VLSIAMVFYRALGCRAMLLFCRLMIVGEFDREDDRSSFGLLIDIDVLSIADGAGNRWRSLGFAESW
jgi:hypothetical protein